jgi:transcriptional regulator with XRE-family HTH domain
MRQEARLTQEALAFRAGLHRTYISMLERGKKSPTVEVLSRLAGAMGTVPSAILRRAEEAGRQGSDSAKSVARAPRERNR